MKSKKYVTLLLAGLSLATASNLVAAKKVNAAPIPVPIPVPLPVVNPILLPGTAPVLMTSKPVGGSEFALFFMDTKKLFPNTRAQALANLTTQLSGEGISPCLVSADINATPLSCGNGLVSFGANQMYSYTLPINMLQLPIKFDEGVRQVFAGNFLSPKGLIPGDRIGHTVHVHFKQPVVQFAMDIDSGQAIAPSIDSVQFVTGAGAAQVSVSQSLLPGTVQWVGIQSLNGITDLDVVATGSTQAFAIDRFVVVPQ